MLRTNVNNWSAETLWQTYIQLTQAESAFRIHKTELSIRPVWHQKKERVQAHIFVCFLAYVLWRLSSNGRSGPASATPLGPSSMSLPAFRVPTSSSRPPTIPAVSFRIRCVVRPDKAQAQLLDRLGLRLPERLKLPTLPAQM